MSLRPATPADFAFIRGLTTDPAYTPFIGDADEAQLSDWCASPACRVMVWGDRVWGDRAGFAVFREVGIASGGVELFRLALARTSGGQGRDFLHALIDFAFQDLAASRVWLDCSSENHRAQRVYEATGFQREGVLRRHWWRPVLGRAVDLVMYGMLREEWQALRTGLEPPAPRP